MESLTGTNMDFNMGNNELILSDRAIRTQEAYFQTTFLSWKLIPLFGYSILLVSTYEVSILFNSAFFPKNLTVT